MLNETHVIRQAKLERPCASCWRITVSTKRKGKGRLASSLEGLGSGEHPAGVKSITHSPMFSKESQWSLLWDCSQWSDFKITRVSGSKEGLKGPWEGAYSHMDSLQLLVHLLCASPTSTRIDLAVQVSSGTLWAIPQFQNLRVFEQLGGWALTAHLWTDIVVPGSDMSPSVTQAAGTHCPLPHMPGVPSSSYQPMANTSLGWMGKASASSSPLLIPWTHLLVEPPRPQCDWGEKGISKCLPTWHDQQSTTSVFHTGIWNWGQTKVLWIPSLPYTG